MSHVQDFKKGAHALAFSTKNLFEISFTSLRSHHIIFILFLSSSELRNKFIIFNNCYDKVQVDRILIAYKQKDSYDHTYFISIPFSLITKDRMELSHDLLTREAQKYNALNTNLNHFHSIVLPLQYLPYIQMYISSIYFHFIKNDR